MADAITDAEIQHLLKFVASTTCKYERNGDLHAGSEAVKHIQQKYEHFKDKIHSAEDFIAYSATKSTMSGNKYHVICAGKTPQDSDQWLLEELKRFRKNNNV